jgi:hypothetical protein
MAAIQALRESLSALGRNPVLFLVGLLYGVVLLPQQATQFAGVPAVPTLLQILTFFVTPFVVAGLLGMADEALDGETSFSTLTRVGKARYVPLLVGNLIEFALTLAFGILAAIVGAVLAVVVLGSGGNAGVGVVAALVVGAVVLLFFLVYFFIQFFPVAIVVGEADAVDGFTESYRLVRNNVVSTLGYSVISFVVGIVTTLPVSGFVFWRSFQNFQQFQEAGGAGGAPTPGQFPGGAGAMPGFSFSTGEIVLISLISLATTMLLFTFQRTFSTAFYRLHDPRTRPEDLVEEFDDAGDDQFGPA